MRLIDADELLNKTAELEAVALEQVRKYEPLDNPREWRIWSAILTERTAFKFDLMDAPIIEAEPIRHGHWIDEKSIGDCCYKCSKCGFIRDAYLLEIENYCPRCGAKMDVPTQKSVGKALKALEVTDETN